MKYFNKCVCCLTDIRKLWDKFYFSLSLWFNTYPFLLSIEEPPKFPLFNKEKDKADPPKLHLLNKKMKRKFRLFLKPHAIKYWTYSYLIISLLSFVPFFIDKTYLSDQWYLSESMVLILGIIFIYFTAYKITFSRVYKVSVLNEAWHNEAKVLGRWFEEVPQRILIKIGVIDKAIKETKSSILEIEEALKNKKHARAYDDNIDKWYELKGHETEFKALKEWVESRKTYWHPKIRNPLYNSPQGLSAQKSVMLIAMLDYYGKINDGKFLKQFNMYFLWFMPAIISFLCIMLYISYDLVTWNCSASQYPSKYAILPSLTWFVFTLLYFKWMFYHISIRDDKELLKGKSQYINIQSMLRGYLTVDHKFYKKFDNKGFQKSVIAAFAIVFSVQIVIIIAIHNICSIYIVNPQVLINVY